jgi:hypothetical protein
VADSFVAAIPDQIAGAEVQYYLAAADLSGRSETLPRTAPAGFYTFTIAAATASPQPTATPLHVTVHPNPFNPQTKISFAVGRSQRVAVAVYDVNGRRLRELVHRVYEPGTHAIVWDGSDDRGHTLPSGTYFIRISTETSTLTRKAMLLR